MPDTIAIDVTDSNDIEIPLEWTSKLGFGTGYVQITLVDDKIAIHKPTAASAKYKSSCKAGDNSYIRSFGLFSVKVPKQLLKQLGIESGCKADLTLEDNCVSIRKNTDAAPEISEPEPIMAFCCVCGNLLYTDKGLVKVLSKYICNECVMLIKKT